MAVAFASKAQTLTDPWANLGRTPYYMAIDASNNIYVTSFSTSTISKITPNGTVTAAWATVGAGPSGIVIDATGNLYTVNRTAKTISKITPNGTVTQFASLGGNEAYTISIDASGNLYAPFVNTNKIAEITSAGSVNLSWVTFGDGSKPFSVIFDASGNLYSANASNSTVHKINSSGTILTTWTLATGSNFQLMTFDAAGNLYIACDGTSSVSKITPSGTATAAWATLTGKPAGIVSDADGNIFTANSNTSTISKISPNGTVTQAFASLVAGASPFNLIKDSSGNLYTTNLGNNTVSKISGPAFYANSYGQKVSLENAISAISPEGGSNLGTGRDIYGKRYNTTNVSTTTGTIGLTSATLGGTISPTNGISSSLGVIYSTNSNFTSYSTATIQSNAAAGTYTSSITGLASSTSYYAKAFVTNSAGTNYGNVVNFTTTSPATPASFSFSSSNLSGNLPNYYLATSNLTLSQLPTAWTIQWTYRLDESIPSADGMHWFFRNPSTTGKYSTDMHLYQINGSLQFWYNNSYSNTDPIMTGLAQNTIYKLALTYDGTNLRTYSNGSLISTKAINITVKPTNSTLRMGSNVARTVDEFRIWDSALSAAQITANQGSSATGSSGLMLYYNFNEGAAGANNTAITSVVDQSGNNRNGTFYNTALNGASNNFVTSLVSGF